SSPVQELEVNGTVQMSGFNLTTAGAADYVLTTNGSGVGSWAAIPPDADWTISVDDMYSAVTGNVGIGVASPAQKLDVDGTAQMTGFKLTPGGATGYVLTEDGSGVGSWQVIPPDADWTISVDDMYSAVTGNVGIGTSGPTAKLDVTGTTGYDQIRMRTSFTPSGTSDASGNQGDVAWDNDYIYVKTGDGWERAALSTW
ncbi:unnamed protein product, partial [marine sediment metagenome]